MRTLLCLGVVLGVAGVAGAQFPKPEEVATTIAAEFAEKSAKPGQTVTLKITVVLKKGWHTYPTVQPDKNAKMFASRIKFDKAAGLKRVGKLKQPANPTVKPEPALQIRKLLEYYGKAVWEQKFIVADDTSGTISVPVKLQLQLCDKNSCLPPSWVTRTAKLTIK